MQAMKSVLAFFVLGWVAVASSVAADYPDWAKPYLKPTRAEWAAKPAVWMLNSQIARFTSVDRVTTIERMVMRVNLGSGRENGIVGASYNPNVERMTKLQAWVVSADGKKTRAFARSRFSDLPSTIGGVEWSSERTVILDVSAEIEIGGYLIYEIERESISPITQVDHVFEARLPTEHCELHVIPSDGVKLLWYATGSTDEWTPAPGNEAGSLRWVKTRLEVWDDNTEFEGFYRRADLVLVRCERPQGTAMDFSSWGNFAASNVSVLESQLRTDGLVAEKAKELTANATTDWERIAALCRFAQRDIRYVQVDLSNDYLAGYRPNPAQDILVNRYGDCKDKATLLISMLRSIGKQGYFLLVSSGDPFAVPEDWPSLTFNHVIVAIPADANTPASWPIVEDPHLGRLVAFDPTNPVAPLGILASEDQGGFGLVVHSPGSALIRMPFEEPQRRGLEQSIHAILAPTGQLVVSMTQEIIGSGGADSYLARLDNTDERYGRRLERRVHSTFPELSGFTWKDAWDATLSRHRIETKFTAANFGRRLGRDRLLVSPGVLVSDRTLPPPPKGALSVMFYPGFVRETVRLKLSAGWAVEELPEAWSLDDPRISASLTYRQEGSEIVYSLSVVSKGGFFDREAYDALRLARQKIHEATRRPAVLRQEEVVAKSPDEASTPVAITEPDKAAAQTDATTTMPVTSAKEAALDELNKVELKSNPNKQEVESFVKAVAASLTRKTAQPTTMRPSVSESMQESVIKKLQAIPSEHLDVLLNEAMATRERYISRWQSVLITVVNERNDLPDTMKTPVVQAFDHYPLLIKTLLRKPWLPDAEAKFIALAKKNPAAGGTAMSRPDARAALADFLTIGDGTTLTKNHFAAKAVNPECVDWSQVVPTAWRKLGLLAQKQGLTDIIDYAPIAAEQGVVEALVLVARKLNSTPAPKGSRDILLRKRCVDALRQVIDGQGPDEAALIRYVLDNRNRLIFDKATGRYVLGK
jgi:hypothetical protein